MKSFNKFVQDVPAYAIAEDIVNLLIQIDEDPFTCIFDAVSEVDSFLAVKYMEDFSALYEDIAPPPLPINAPNSTLGTMAGNVWGGIKQAWNTYKNTQNNPQRKFHFAWKTIEQLIRTMQTPDLANINGTKDVLSTLNQVRTNLSKAWQNHLSGQNQQANQTQAAPRSATPPQNQQTNQTQASPNQDNYMNDFIKDVLGDGY